MAQGSRRRAVLFVVCAVAALCQAVAWAAPMDLPVQQVAMLYPFFDVIENGIRFGGAVAMHGDTMVVGAPWEDALAYNSGGAYVFVRVDDEWYLQAKLVPPDGASADLFGASVALDGPTVVVGAPEDDNVGGGNAGAAYVFVRSGSNWTLQQKLTAADGAAGDSFGISVAVDGDTVVAGAYSHDTPAADCGAAYIFTRSGGTWSQQQKLGSNDSHVSDWFGGAVALEGDTAVIGAPRDDHAGPINSGAVYVFVRAGTVWTQQQRLVAGDAAIAAELGVSVAVSHDTVIAGAYQDAHAGGENHGSAYVFVRSGAVWGQQAKLVASDAAEDDYFGWSVAVDQDTAVVGAPYADYEPWMVEDAGAAYVFVRSGAIWSQQQILSGEPSGDDLAGMAVAVSGDAVAIGARNYDHPGGTDSGWSTMWERSAGVWTWEQSVVAGEPYPAATGRSVALSGDLLVVGQAGILAGWVEEVGAAHVFVWSDPYWTHRWSFIDFGGSPNDHLGYAVAVDGTTAVVGAPGDGPVIHGRAEVYVTSGSGWTLQGLLQGTANQTIPDGFGMDVAIDGDTLVVGAPNETNASDVQIGAAYVFVRSGPVWSLQQKLVASDAAQWDYFGRSVAVHGDTVAIGAPEDDNAAGIDAGSAYVFTRSGTTWSLQQKLIAGDGFGGSMAIDGDTLVVGDSRAENSAAITTGAAYVFVRSGALWSQQQKLEAADGAYGDYFGLSVTLAGDTAVVGAPYDDHAGGDSAGSAYLFTRSGTTWSEVEKVVADDPASGALFGYSVALEGNRLAVGATHYRRLPEDDLTGATYVFELGSPQGELPFSDGFESGDTSAWSAAVGGSVGAVVMPLGGVAGGYQTSLRIDPQLTAALGTGPVTALIGLGSGDTRVFSVELRWQDGAAEVRADARTDRGQRVRTDWVPVSRDAQWLGIDWRAAVAERDDGRLRVDVDGSPLLALEGLDNGDSRLELLVVTEVDGRPLVYPRR